MSSVTVEGEVTGQAAGVPLEEAGFTFAVSGVVDAMLETAAAVVLKPTVSTIEPSVASQPAQNGSPSAPQGDLTSSSDTSGVLGADQTGLRDQLMKPEVGPPATDGQNSGSATVQAPGPGLGWDPGEQLTPERRAELNQYAAQSLDNYLHGQRHSRDAEKITYTEYGQFLGDLQKDSTLNDPEKFYVMNKFTAKAAEDFGRANMSNEGARPDVLDDFWLQRDGSASHAMMTTDNKWFVGFFGNKTTEEIWDFLAAREKDDVISHLPAGPLREAGRVVLAAITDGDAFNEGDFNAHFRLYANVVKPGLIDKLDFNAYADGWRKSFLSKPD
jgi:hypothetical protein